jgi:hypothetical protein
MKIILQRHSRKSTERFERRIESQENEEYPGQSESCSTGGAGRLAGYSSFCGAFCNCWPARRVCAAFGAGASCAAASASTAGAPGRRCAARSAWRQWSGRSAAQLWPATGRISGRWSARLCWGQACVWRHSLCGAAQSTSCRAFAPVVGAASKHACGAARAAASPGAGL